MDNTGMSLQKVCGAIVDTFAENVESTKHRKTLHEAADNGSAAAKTAIGIGIDLKLDGMSQRNENVLENFAEAAKKGYAPALHRLGLCYLNGEFAPVDIDKAYKCFENAASKGYAPAQYVFGSLSMNKNDVAKGEEYLLKAAEQGIANAQFELAEYYRREPKPNYEKALKWYRRAAKMGHNLAQYVLGLVYSQECDEEESST